MKDTIRLKPLSPLLSCSLPSHDQHLSFILLVSSNSTGILPGTRPPSLPDSPASMGQLGHQLPATSSAQLSRLRNSSTLSPCTLTLSSPFLSITHCHEVYFAVEATGVDSLDGITFLKTASATAATCKLQHNKNDFLHDAYYLSTML